MANLTVPVFDGGNLYANASYIAKKVNSYANHRTPYWKGEYFGSNNAYKNPLYNGGIGFSPTFEGNLEEGDTAVLCGGPQIISKEKAKYAVNKTVGGILKI